MLALIAVVGLQMSRLHLSIYIIVFIVLIIKFDFYLGSLLFGILPVMPYLIDFNVFQNFVSSCFLSLQIRSIQCNLVDMTHKNASWQRSLLFPEDWHCYNFVHIFCICQLGTPVYSKMDIWKISDNNWTFWVQFPFSM